jgi:hypothetical protein
MALAKRFKWDQRSVKDKTHLVAGIPPRALRHSLAPNNIIKLSAAYIKQL